ncbi:hypothetical protein Aph02nite_16670 [Actinoplanes philippinensis]|uniref:HEAT repeat n=1 Tax=Actinoplanes philippinensis TaxID=35752 RepID=A0A1I2B8V0_9ACTN|nr:HEAT repeat domain-containing protein [Actinoplanes philippinensis]GIE75717.1 hypothetical protein Aph02nite_16670 [Actinoplanes philippinensis]SFE51580.1 HEAT repeat [Actinoplanes philippinensis]
MIGEGEALGRLRAYAERFEAGRETVERIASAVAAGDPAAGLRGLLERFLDEQDHDGRDITAMLLADVAGAGALPVLTMAADRDLGDTPHDLTSMIDDLVGRERAAAREALRGMVTGGSAEQCRIALEWSEPVLTAADVDLLAGCAGRPEREIRVLAVEVVPGPDVDGRAFRVLTDALRDVDPGVRLAAVTRLGEVRRWDCVPPLAALTTDPDPSVRARAAYVLGRIGAASRASAATPAREAGREGAGRQEMLLAALRVLLGDEDERVRGRAGEALGVIGGDPAVGVLLAEAEAGDPRQRVRAAKGLAQVVDDDPRAEPAIRALARDADASVRAAVLSGLATAGGISGRWQPLVDELAADTDVTVRHRVVGTVAHLHPYPRKILTVLASADPSGFVREAAATALAALR